MSAIANAFSRCRAGNRAAVIPYFMAGYPSTDQFCDLVQAAFGAGADLVEVGIPFSDPVADGPAIQHAGQGALELGVTTGRVLELLRSLGLRPDQPIVLMSYLNPILQYGLDRFVTEAARVGASGLIIPDLVIEEGKPIESACRRSGIDLIYLVAPTSPSDRVQSILRRSRGFVYAISVLGVTGVRSKLPDNLVARLAELKKSTRLPVVVGFGISSPEAAADAATIADGVVIGSALVERIRASHDEKAPVKDVADLIRQFRTAITTRAAVSEIKR